MKKAKMIDRLKVCFFMAFILFNFNNLYAQDLNPIAWPHLKGYWKFQNAAKLTKASIGKDLVLVGSHQYIAGPSIGDTAIRIGIGSYYQCMHNMAPNGGGDSVNRYTLMFDFKVLSFKKWHTFFKSDSGNTNDGECFVRPITGSNPGRIGVGATGYSIDSINPNQWYRLMISVNLNNFYRYYINGKLFHEGDTQEVDGRFALTPKMIFFGDDNQEDDTIDVASVAVFDTCLSAKDIAKIGSIDPCVANPPKISLGRDTSLCDYNSIVKNAGTGFKKYLWSTGSVLSSVTITKNIGLGKKNVWCKVTDANGCTTSDTFILIYYASPVINLGTNQSFCQGYTTKLIAGTDTSFQYLWKFLPKGNTLSIKNIFYTDSGGKYAVIVTSKSGCMASDTIQITVFKRPAKPSITITGKTNLCAGESVSLAGPNGYFGYLWNNGSDMQTIISNKNDTFKLKVIDTNNCTSVFSDSIVVKVFALPPIPKIQVTGKTTFCEGDSVTFNLTSGYALYVWQDQSRNQSYRYVHSTGLYYAYVKDNNGCSSPFSDSVLIKVNALPAKPTILQLPKGKSDLCQGESIFLWAPSGYKGYVWWPNNNTTQIDTITTSGTYMASVIDANGCTSIYSNSFDIIVHPLPAKPVVIKAGKDILQSDVLANQYRWFLNTILLTDTGRIITSAPSGYYQVQIKDKWCWSVVSDSFFYSNSGIVKLKGNSQELLIYPNPTSSEFLLQINNLELIEDAILIVTDMIGKQVYNESLNTSDLRNGIIINLANITSGVYQIRVITKEVVFTGKIEKL